VAGLRSRGALGAGALGLVFGLALGPCTFAFLVPVLGAAFAVGAHGAIGGTVLVLAFAAGHTLLIVIAGSSVNHVHRVVVATSRTRMQLWRHASGALVILGGLYVLYAA
jgi:cytochrome c-type biogenesis protein